MEQLTKFGKNMYGCASDEMVSCHELAEAAWGKEVCNDQTRGLAAFAYLWRRFGPPFMGTDPHKRLVCYYLTTSDPDIFLGIDVSASGLSYSTCYLAKNSVREAHQKPIFKKMKKWDNAFERWWIKNHPEFKDQIKNWKKLNPEEKKKIQDMYGNDFYNQDVYKKAKADLGEHPNCHQESKTTRRLKRVLTAAMKELLRPVFVRDVPINILGRVLDAEYAGYGESETDCAPRSKYAGYGVPKGAMDKLVKKYKENEE